MYPLELNVKRSWQGTDFSFRNEKRGCDPHCYFDGTIKRVGNPVEDVSFLCVNGLTANNIRRRSQTLLHKRLIDPQAFFEAKIDNEWKHVVEIEEVDGCILDPTIVDKLYEGQRFVPGNPPPAVVNTVLELLDAVKSMIVLNVPIVGLGDASAYVRCKQSGLIKILRPDPEVELKDLGKLGDLGMKAVEDLMEVVDTYIFREKDSEWYEKSRFMSCFRERYDRGLRLGALEVIEMIENHNFMITDILDAFGFFPMAFYKKEAIGTYCGRSLFAASKALPPNWIKDDCGPKFQKSFTKKFSAIEKTNTTNEYEDTNPEDLIKFLKDTLRHLNDKNKEEGHMSYTEFYKTIRTKWKGIIEDCYDTLFSEITLPDEDNNRTLWIQNLEQQIDEKDLKNHFPQNGEVVSVIVIRNKQTNLSQGYGSIKFVSHAVAERILLNHTAAWKRGADIKFWLKWPEYTLYVDNLASDVTYKTLLDTFKGYSSVKRAKVVTDRNGPKGFVYFGNKDEKNRAMSEMNGRYCSSLPMIIDQAANTNAKVGGQSQTPKAASYQGSPGAQGEDDPTCTTLFVGNVHSSVTHSVLSELFRNYGRLLNVKILEGKNCAFVQFAE